MNRPITLCDRCKEYAHCCLNYDGDNCRRSRTVEPLNADRIRSMTDGELAEKIGESIDCEVCKTMHHSESGECPCRPHQACVDFWLDWLRQEAKEDAVN